MQRPHFPTQTYLDIAREHAKCLLPSTKTETEERTLYEDAHLEESPSLKDRIHLAMLLITQNEELEKKIAAATRQLEEEKLKSSIFQQNMTRNEETLREWRGRREDLELSQNEQMMALNQSSIPNKSQEMSTTYNSNWHNEFLDKDCLDALWNKSKRPNDQTKPRKVTVKTIDLSMPTQRSEHSKPSPILILEESINSKSHIQTKLRGEKSKGKESAWEKGKKYAQMHERRCQQLQDKKLHRPISELRKGSKRGKVNPEV